MGESTANSAKLASKRSPEVPLKLIYAFNAQPQNNLVRRYIMKHSYTALLALLMVVGLSACDRSDPTAEDAPTSLESTLSATSDSAEEASDEVIGAIDNAIEAMDEMADEAIEDANNSLDELTSD